MSPMARINATLLLVFVLLLAMIVYAAAGNRSNANPLSGPGTDRRGGPATVAPRSATPAEPSPLPRPAAEMREAILTAVRSGLIEELQIPLDWNEMRPELGQDKVEDPVAYLKKLSGDGEGREILAVLGRILEMRYAVAPMGRDFENNRIFVWPYLVAADLSKLTPAEEVDLYRLMSPAEAKAMLAKKKWTWWRLSIGADGTWHAFLKDD